MIRQAPGGEGTWDRELEDFLCLQKKLREKIGVMQNVCTRTDKVTRILEFKDAGT